MIWYFKILFVVMRIANGKFTMNKIIYNEEHQKIARYAKAMAHPARVFVLELLSKQACCYSGDLSDDLPIAKSTLSQHLKN